MEEISCTTWDPRAPEYGTSRGIMVYGVNPKPQALESSSNECRADICVSAQPDSDVHTPGRAPQRTLLRFRI